LSVALGHGSIALAVGEAFVPAGFVPERELDAIPESKFVKDRAQVVFRDILDRADDLGHLAIFESPGDELDDLLLAWAGDACGHGRTRF
jgi:hypothetical protein